MALDNNIDFEGSDVQSTTNSTNSDNVNDTSLANQADATDINGGGDSDITGKDGTSNEQTTQDNNQGGNDDTQSSSTGELKTGDKVEFNDVTYTVDENGNLVDDNGAVFKESKDVQAWLDSVSAEDEDDMSISSIQKALGVEIADDKGNPIEFDDTPEGVKAYVNAVLDLKANELQQGALNKFFNENPVVRQFMDYLYLNNGDPRGFGQIPDRQSIQLNAEDDRQLEYIIRMAAQEFGNKSVTDAYIKYLKDTGNLYSEAESQLQALVEKDKAVRQQLAEQAEMARKQEQERINEYWQNVNNAISNRTIAGYKLPESFIKQVNGQKITLTPNDFYDYLSKQVTVDEDGNRLTGYQRDLNELSDSDLLNRELLDAWLMFTGGSYKDLVDMAIKEDKVRVLKIKSKEQRSAKTVKVVSKKNNKTDINDIIL